MILLRCMLVKSIPLGTKGSSLIASIIGCRPSLISKSSPSHMVALTYPSCEATSARLHRQSTTASLFTTSRKRPQYFCDNSSRNEAWAFVAAAARDSWCRILANSFALISGVWYRRVNLVLKEGEVQYARYQTQRSYPDINIHDAGISRFSFLLNMSECHANCRAKTSNFLTSIRYYAELIRRPLYDARSYFIPSDRCVL